MKIYLVGKYGHFPIGNYSEFLKGVRTMRETILKNIREHNELMGLIDEACVPSIEQAALELVKALESGNKLISFGNGGSAADAQHFACELVGTFEDKTRRGLPAIALSANTSSLTSISNDFSYDMVFERQIEALAQKGDLCVGISTSGNSQNVYQALMKAKEMGCFNVAMLGGDGGKIKQAADCPIIVPSTSTPRIQEVHILIIHIICSIVDEAFGE